MRILLLCLPLAACGSPPCLDKGQTAVVLNVGDANSRNDVSVNSIKIRTADKAVRVCVVPQFTADQLARGDIIKGPITRDRDWYIQ